MNGTLIHSLNLLAWTDLSQQSYGSAMTAPFSYSDVTTFKAQLAYILVIPRRFNVYRLCMHSPSGVYI